MSDRKDVIDISLHTGAAIIWSTMAGIGMKQGLNIYLLAPSDAEKLFGLALAAFAIIGLIACLMYWPGRERWQHGFDWGGVQSQKEWIIPDAAAIVSFAVASYLS